MRLERNPNHQKFKLPDGYKDCGFQFSYTDDVRHCIDAKHQRTEFDNSLYMYRCTDVVKICDQCKIVWHVDMSD